jgi:hypothetical protein
MNAKWTSGVLTVLFATVLAGSALEAKPKDKKHGGDHAKHSAAHEAAVQQCTAAYEASAAAAHAPKSPTGKTRMRAMHAAAEAKKACVARAPK